MRTRFSASVIVESPIFSGGRVGEAARVSSWRNPLLQPLLLGGRILQLVVGEPDAPRKVLLEELLCPSLREAEAHETRHDVATLSDRRVRLAHFRARRFEARELRAKLRDGVGSSLETAVFFSANAARRSSVSASFVSVSPFLMRECIRSKSRRCRFSE